MKLFGIALCTLFSAICAMNSLTLVRAGKPRPAHAFPSEIIVLPAGSFNAAPEICLGNYSTGISVRCDIAHTTPFAMFFLNGNWVSTETHVPYHIAGDRDFGGLIEIFKWHGLEKVSTNSDGIKKAEIKCEFRNRFGTVTSITRRVKIRVRDC